MNTVYKNMDRKALDAAYNNSLAVANSAELMAEFGRESALMRLAPGARLGLRYGPAERNLIDYFPVDRPEPCPLLLFIHGGYWQMRSKEDFSFLAKGAQAHGMHVAMVGYTLAPEATLAQITEEIRASIRWLGANAGKFGGDPQNIVLAGWSAGAHLTALCMDEPGVVGGLAISGIYDLEPVRLSYLNAKLGLSQADVKLLSPLMQPLSPRPLVVAYGASELPELQAQSKAFFDLRNAASRPSQLMALPGLNHFTILPELANPDGVLAMAAIQLATKK